MAMTLPKPTHLDTADVSIMMMRYQEPPASEDYGFPRWPVAHLDGHELYLVRTAAGWVSEFQGIRTSQPLPWAEAMREAHESIISEVYDTLWQAAQ